MAQQEGPNDASTSTAVWLQSNSLGHLIRPLSQEGITVNELIEMDTQSLDNVLDDLVNDQNVKQFQKRDKIRIKLSIKKLQKCDESPSHMPDQHHHASAYDLSGSTNIISGHVGDVHGDLHKHSHQQTPPKYPGNISAFIARHFDEKHHLFQPKIQVLKHMMTQFVPNDETILNINSVEAVRQWCFHRFDIDKMNKLKPLFAEYKRCQKKLDEKHNSKAMDAMKATNVDDTRPLKHSATKPRMNMAKEPKRKRRKIDIIRVGSVSSASPPKEAVHVVVKGGLTKKRLRSLKSDVVQAEKEIAMIEKMQKDCEDRAGDSHDDDDDDAEFMDYGHYHETNVIRFDAYTKPM
eukprot:123102_1